MNTEQEVIRTPMDFVEFSNFIKKYPNYASMLEAFESYGKAEFELLDALYKVYLGNARPQNVNVLKTLPKMEVPKIVTADLKQPFYKSFEKRRKRK